MSTGPQHYAEAERLLALLEAGTREQAVKLAEAGGASAVAFIIAKAGVHATLALTAATTGQETLGSDWRETLGYEPRPRETPRPDTWDEVKP